MNVPALEEPHLREQRKILGNAPIAEEVSYHRKIAGDPDAAGDVS
jgi:hypothetical protein